PVERSFKVSVRPLRTEAATGAAAIVLLLDLTDATRVDRMRVDFVAIVSHVLRTPMTSLIGFIESLRGPARDDAEARERFLSIMDEQATRMARLVADLMSLARIELEEHQTPTARVSLDNVVRRTVDALKPVAARKSIAIDIVVPQPAVQLTVLGDDDQLVQVVQNLVDNAVKYGKPGGAVRVELAREHDEAAKRDMIALTVADQGDGIEPHHLARLTERFYRVDSARSRDLGGTGLGLAIVKHILNRHQGSLRIHSVVGQGSQFVVRLPAAAPGAGA
ncbi:MAG: ATP-binding protein, partial [Alphaproteobacteria bacterium]